MVKPQVTGYLYPWDVLGDPAAASWVKDTGVHRVALAAAYHSVRAATPRHPGRRVVDAGSAALYVPVTGAWDGNVPTPGDAAEWTGRDDSFSEAAEIIRRAGLPVDAWMVLTHSSAVGKKHPGLCVQNAFGEIYRHALCPSHPAVREYAAALVAQVMELGRPDGLVLEAVGPLGFSHQNQHEKTAGADYSPWVQAMLSLCFCDACCRTYSSRGIATETVRRRIRDAILRDENAASVPDTASGSADFKPLLQARWEATAVLLDACLRSVANSGLKPKISLHVSPDPWSTGPFMSVDALHRSKLWPGHDVTAVVPCWEDAAQGAATIDSMQAAAPEAKVGSYVLVLPPKAASASSLAQEWGELVGAGSRELHVYHLGLASTQRLDAAARVIRKLGDPGRAEAPT
ncbi:hypothetical protein ACTAQI_15310 [Pseudarthrobacter sp. alpha12b]